MEMETNRNYKDSVFTALFNDPDLLRELYCALGEVDLSSDVPVYINTLKNVLYMGKYNDISFEIGGKLVILVEHQSTLNPNMALRFLFFITRILEKRIQSNNLYSTKQLLIPWPEFYVLYNGTTPFPDNAVLRLSDLYEDPQDLGLPEKLKPMLEMEVKVLNINEGRNEEIVKRCKKLVEYSAFIGKVRYYLAELGNLEESIKKAVKYCQKHDILNEFLVSCIIQSYICNHIIQDTRNSPSEILNMILEEWNTEDAIAFAREEGREEGILTTARNALTKGYSPESIQEITGLDMETIKSLKN